MSNVWGSKLEWEKANNYGYIEVYDDDTVSASWYPSKKDLIKAVDGKGRGWLSTRKQFGAFLKEHPELKYH